MGYIAHHAIIVTSFSEEDAKQAHAKALELFPDVSDTMASHINLYSTFLIPPDGSKEGWEDSDKGNSRRAEFIEWMKQSELCLSWVEIQYGDDEGNTKIVNDSDKELREDLYTEIKARAS